VVDRNLKWNRRFLEVAKLVSTWSKDPSTKVGAVIVNPRMEIVGTGYNGFPRGVLDLEERYSNRDMKYKLVVHAELNAVLQAKERALGGTIYVYPTIMIPSACPECCKAIVHSGIHSVVYYEDTGHELRWQEHADYSKLLLEEGGVSYYSVPREEVVEVNFTKR
jgi:dCMP deaminase